MEERASEAPPAVVRRICGYVGLYVWWQERESEISPHVNMGFFPNMAFGKKSHVDMTTCSTFS